MSGGAPGDGCGGEALDGGSDTAPAAGMRRVVSCPDHKALDTMPDPVTEVCDLQVN